MRNSIFITFLLFLVVSCAEGIQLEQIVEAETVSVLVGQNTELGRELDNKFGEKIVRWCGDQKASFCSHKLAKIISEKSQVDALTAFVNKHTDGWSTPYSGAPVPIVKLRFSDKAGATIGSFGAGSTFFSRGRADTLTLSASKEDVSRLFSLIDVDPKKTGI